MKARGGLVIKLTRLNNHIVAINPDHISWADATPDTTLFMISGEKFIVRETVDELIAQIVDFRQRIRMIEPIADRLGPIEGDPPRFTMAPAARRASDPPGSIRSRGGP
jgi:flagellar protein FlbD